MSEVAAPNSELEFLRQMIKQQGEQLAALTKAKNETFIPTFPAPELSDQDLLASFLATFPPPDGKPDPHIVRFYTKAVRDDEKSMEAGRPVFRNAEWVQIQQPGSTSEMRIREARRIDKLRWPREYSLYKAGQERGAVGVPLSEAPFLTEAQREEFAANGLRSVENLRDMSDVEGQKFMGFNAVRAKAKAYLDALAGNAPIEKLQSEIEKRDAKLAVFQKALEEQAAKIAELSKRK